MYDFLSNSGFQVNLLTFQDILDHELITLDYDVFVLVDNCPRENITDLVTEFWLGGGGILSFDDGAAYLGYAGILPRETQGVDHGYGTYWVYRSNTEANITIRHPVTKRYALEEQLFVDDTYPRPQYDRTVLDTTSLASDIIYLAMDESNSDWFQALAVDPSDKGGRVVQIGVDMWPWPSDWEDMMPFFSPAT